MASAHINTAAAGRLLIALALKGGMNKSGLGPSLLTFLLLLYFVLFCLLPNLGVVASTSELERTFTKSFMNSCMKYPFVQQYWDSLEHPTGRHVVFVLQEPGLKNGGFGDRIGGLLTAAMMAMRFNRTLLVQSSNGLYFELLILSC